MDLEEAGKEETNDDCIDLTDDNSNIEDTSVLPASDSDSDDSDCVGTWSNKKDSKRKKRSPYVSDMEEEEHEEEDDDRDQDPSEVEAEQDSENNIDTTKFEKEEEVSEAKQNSEKEDENGPESSWNGCMRSDFEIMWQRKKQSKEWCRKARKHDDIIDDSEKVASLVHEMQRAAEEDILLNCRGKPSTKKIVILSTVMTQLRKRFLQQSFLEVGLLNVLKQWLTPLPNRSMQPLQVRESVLQLLLEFPGIDKDLLKDSGIGKVVMYLYKHPKETKGNKKKAAQLIDKWARLIYNKFTDFKDMSKEERMQRDLGLLPKKLDGSGREERSARKDFMEDLVSSGKDKSLCPGDKGWIARARVPMPSTKAYIYRPQWENESSIPGGSRKQFNQLEKFIKYHVITNRKKQASRAVPVSIDGRNTAFYTDDRHQNRNFL